MNGRRGFTMLEVMVSIAILALLTAALLAFGLRLGDRRDRVMFEGERAATLSRVFNRMERAALGAQEPLRWGEDWLEIDSRGVWPSFEGGAGPIGPVEVAGRLSYSAGERELLWEEVGPGGRRIELRAADIEALRVDRFEDLPLARGAAAPLRVRVWLRPLGLPETDGRTRNEDGGLDAPRGGVGPMEPVGRPADFVRAVLEVGVVEPLEESGALR